MSRTIRNLGLAEIGTLLDWAAAEGWNPGLDDAVAFHAADPHGFFGAFVDGVMVAGISAVAYDDCFGFIGLYICHPDWRGKGHGRAVWDAGMAYLGSRTIGLDGVPEQQANYARMGFVGAYDTIRMSGVLGPVAGAAGARGQPGLTDIAALDRACFPARRDEFLRHWLVPPHRSIFHADAGHMQAYAVLRPCRDGAKIGPLFAGTTPMAFELVSSLSGPVHIDVPAMHTDWLAALRQLGFTPGFSTRRMYRGSPPQMDLSRVFGVTTLELG
ncbi:GNAT family N-acetyltransferase [Devosia sp. FJ2-5-3]|jgi:GNAT superfamily N-acetyltransferase|uniref:GNAT family N-acetyltransferase n=1 Tax=Devosia sp. FJ2-5-3 TaxID=2976680 RepID=UPI0023D7FE68|nr:GNAT family N-acetyltransferase [Devosia sp. FJ2-5-3]WEJ58730.1 GNAT family N-acetyltransferase [Devosia sp. FJ2-5-3]